MSEYTHHRCTDPDCHDPACTGEHHHRCTDPDCHDPACTGEHHHHCTDPDCHDPACTGEHVHEGPEHAAVFAEKRSFTPASPVHRAKLEDAAREVFSAIAARACIDGILPGHAKGLVETDGGAFALSLTAADCIDTRALESWNASDAFISFSVTINVHLIVPCALDADALFAPFAAL